MASFRDKSGQAWEIEITILTARTIKSRTGVNAYQMLDETVMQQIGDDPLIFTDILWACCERQAAARGIGFEPFLLLINDTIDEALEAVWLAAVELLPEKKRAPGRKIVEVLIKTSAGALAEATARVDRIDPAKLSADLVADLAREMDRATAATRAEPPSGN